MNPISALQRQYRLNGAGGTLSAAWGKVLCLFKSKTDPWAEWDRSLGVDTCGNLIPDKLDVVGNWMDGQRYQGCDPVNLQEILRALSMPTATREQATFIDLGSGKGRALIVGSLLPFYQAVGVEYSFELCEIADDNLRKLRIPASRAYTLCCDAAEYPFPWTPLVVYMYNPFGKETMRKVLENLRESLRFAPRPHRIIYQNRLCVGILRDFCHCVSDDGWTTVWEVKP